MKKNLLLIVITFIAIGCVTKRGFDKKKDSQKHEREENRGPQKRAKEMERKYSEKEMDQKVKEYKLNLAEYLEVNHNSKYDKNNKKDFDILAKYSVEASEEEIKVFLLSDVVKEMIVETNHHNDKVREKKLQLTGDPDGTTEDENQQEINGRKSFYPILLLSTGVTGFLVYKEFHQVGKKVARKSLNKTIAIFETDKIPRIIWDNGGMVNAVLKMGLSSAIVGGAIVIFAQQGLIEIPKEKKKQIDKVIGGSMIAAGAISTIGGLTKTYRFLRTPGFFSGTKEYKFHMWGVNDDLRIGFEPLTPKEHLTRAKNFAVALAAVGIGAAAIIVGSKMISDSSKNEEAEVDSESVLNLTSRKQQQLEKISQISADLYDLSRAYHSL